MAEPCAAALPYVAGPPTSRQAILDAAVAASARWDLPDPDLVRLGINGVFACGDVILRVAAPTVPATASVELMDVLDAAGVRVPRPWRPSAGRGPVWEAGDGLWVTAWERIHHDPTAAVDWRQVGEMVRRVHELRPGDIPSAHPLPWCSGFPWWHFDRLIESASPLIDDHALEAIGACVSRNRWVLERSGTTLPVVCHGDVHPGNVLVSADGPVLIDWDLLCWGPPGWDHAMLLTWSSRWGGEPGVYDHFAAGYGRDLHDDPAARSIAELRLVAATFGRALAAPTDAAAAEELDRRLRWWRGDRDAPMWRAM